MKRIVLGSTVIAIVSGIALATPAAAGTLTYRERVAIANSKSHLHALRARIRADGKVTFWERMKLRAAVARHRALAHRLHSN
jgi:uncharacterized lipoprotein YbaY